MLPYDLHIHSCLSPCGDNDMTVNNIIGMAKVNGLKILALTDHNTCKNIPSIAKVAKVNDIILIPGMELTTAEEVHVVCLLPDLDSAWYFDKFVYSKLPNIKNKEHIFGQQLILDEHDNVIGSEEKLLINATEISITNLPHIIAHYGGFAFPAHIDKSSNGILSILGTIPEDCYFSVVEVFRPPLKRSDADGLFVVTNSDAHYLWDISDGQRMISTKDFSENFPGILH